MHGHDALNMCSVFWKIIRREGQVMEEGQWKRGAELHLQFIIALEFRQLHLESVASDLTCVKQEANSSH